MSDPTTQTTEAPNPLAELQAAARALDKGARKLAELQREFDGRPDNDRVWQPGPKLRWLELHGDMLSTVAQEYEDAEKRAPNVDVLKVRATARAKVRDPELYADYHRLEGEIAAYTKWVSAKKQSVSALQSVLRGEVQLDGVRMPQPAWSGRT